MSRTEAGTQRPDRRFPRRVYGGGTEPDVRFTLANERTFLAWIRTSLALIAGGVALEALGLSVHAGMRLAASLVLLALGMALPAQAWWHWGHVESAMRRGAHLPAPRLGLPLAVGVGVLVVVGVLVGEG
jgi:putative membrane protein